MNMTKDDLTGRIHNMAKGTPALRQPERTLIEMQTRAFEAAGGVIEQVDTHVVTVDYLKKRDNCGRVMK